MHSSLFISVCLAATSIAAPAILNDVYKPSNELADFYGKVSKHIDNARQILDPSSTCDTSKIALPSSSDLPSPDDQKPIYVALGRGTQVKEEPAHKKSHDIEKLTTGQNYSCETSTSDSKPEAIGAVANLYNATCIAASYPDMLAMLPKIAYKTTNIKDLSSSLPPANIDLLGHHFFQGSTPVFNLDTTAAQQYGIAFTKVQKKVDAPSDAEQGDNGAVKWLYLSTIDGTVGDYKSVYRVDTAAGAAPKTCENMPSVITVQYAANYYFYK